MIDGSKSGRAEVMAAITGLAKEVEHLATKVRRIAAVAERMPRATATKSKERTRSPTQDRFFLDYLCNATCRYFPG